MLKHIALALLLAGQSEQFYTLEDYEIGRASKVTCKGEPLPEDFACALVFNLDPPVPDGIASISGGEYDLIRGITLILDGSLYTAVYDPPLRRENGLSSLRRNARIPARVDGDYLLVLSLDGKQARAKIVRRENLNHNRPQPA